MIRKYLENEINSIKEDLKYYQDMGFKDDVLELENEIAELEKQDVPYELIYIENAITINTLRKIVKTSAFNLDQYADMEQPLENLDNGYITKKMLEMIIRLSFRENAKGSFPNSTTQAFGSRDKVRFIKSKLEELL